MQEGNNPAEAGTAADASDMTREQMAQAIGSSIFDDPEKPLSEDENKAEAEAEPVEPSEEDETEEQPDTTDDADNNDAEDAGEEDEQEEAAFAADDMFINLDDGSKATVRELKEGNLRLADYRRKTQELSREKDAFQAEKSSIKQLEEAAAREREAMATVLQATMPQEPDPSLIETEPTVYMQQKAAYDRQREALQQVFRAQAIAQQQQQQKAAQDHQEYLQKERAALNDAVPEFRDDNAFGKFKNDAVAFLQREGFTTEELNGLSDHRMMKVIRKAMQADKIEQAKPVAQKAMKDKPKTMKSAARKGKGSRANATALDRVNKAAESRSVESVTDILGTLLTE